MLLLSLSWIWDTRSSRISFFMIVIHNFIERRIFICVCMFVQQKISLSKRVPFSSAVWLGPAGSPDQAPTLFHWLHTILISIHSTYPVSLPEIIRVIVGYASVFNASGKFAPRDQPREMQQEELIESLKVKGQSTVVNHNRYTRAFFLHVETFSTGWPHWYILFLLSLSLLIYFNDLAPTHTTLV